MGTVFYGALAGILVVASAVPYSIRTWQGKIVPHVGSWSLWTFIGLAILLTYRSAGAEDNLWPAIFGFTNPLLVTLIVLRNRRKDGTKPITPRGMWNELTALDRVCVAFGFAALGLWLYAGHDPKLHTMSLVTAVLADAGAAVQTVVFLWKKPGEDRPFAWSVYAAGYGTSFLALPNYSFDNIIVPAYMTITALFIALPLVLHRIRTKAPIGEWI